MMELAALLHDFASVSNDDWIKDHQIHGARLAGDLLIKLDYPYDKIELKKCILSHRTSTNLVKSSIEEQILADADAMAHIQNFRSLIYFAYVQKGLGVEEGTEWVMSEIDKCWSKMTLGSQIIMKNKYRLLKRILR